MDPDESTPRVSITAYSPTVEQAHHNEVSISRRIGKTNLQLAGYLDRKNRKERGTPNLIFVG